MKLIFLLLLLLKSFLFAGLVLKGSPALTPVFSWHQVLDQNENSAWVSREFGDDRRPFLKIEFSQEKELKGLSFFSSMMPKENSVHAWSDYHRPKNVTLLFSDGSKQRHVLQDVPFFQFIPIQKKTRFVKVFFAEVYPGSLNRLAIAECRPVFEQRNNLSFSFAFDDLSSKADNEVLATLQIDAPIVVSEDKQERQVFTLLLDALDQKNIDEDFLPALPAFLAAFSENDVLKICDLTREGRVIFEGNPHRDSEQKKVLDLFKRWRYDAIVSQKAIIQMMQKIIKSSKENLHQEHFVYLNAVERKLINDFDDELFTSRVQMTIFDLAPASSSWLILFSKRFAFFYVDLKQDLSFYMASFVEDVFQSRYTQAELRLFASDFLELKTVDGHAFVEKDEGDAILLLPALLPGQSKRFTLRFQRVASPLSQNRAVFIQGVFRYYDGLKASIQQRLLSESLNFKAL